MQTLSKNPIWVYVYILEIVLNTNILVPTNIDFLREEILNEGVIKRVIKEGQGDKVPKDAKLWIKYQGRTDDGYEFQKPNNIVAKPNAIYSQAWHLAWDTMKRGEIC